MVQKLTESKFGIPIEIWRLVSAGIGCTNYTACSTKYFLNIEVSLLEGSFMQAARVEGAYVPILCEQPYAAHESLM